MTTSDYMRVAIAASQASDDPDTQTGCVLAFAGPLKGLYVQGANQLPRGVRKTQDRLVRPEKYRWIEHAERVAIFSAARAGQSTHGAIAYQFFMPCMDCARALVFAGITRLVVDRKRHEEICLARQNTLSVLERGKQINYNRDFDDIPTMLREAGVKLELWSEGTGPGFQQPILVDQIGAFNE